MKIALITGANRGIGKEVARQLAKKFTIIAGIRDLKNGSKLEHEFKNDGLTVHLQELDISDSKSISNAVFSIIQKFGRIDVLINNAAILLDRGASILNSDRTLINETLNTNFFGPLELTQQVIPLMEENKYGRIVNISSGIAAFEPEEMRSAFGGRTFSYRLSKSMLNFMTYLAAVEVNQEFIKINAVCPGSVQTDMGGQNAPTTVEEAAETIVWLATQGKAGASGKFFRNKAEIPW